MKNLICECQWAFSLLIYGPHPFADRLGPALPFSLPWRHLIWSQITMALMTTRGRRMGAAVFRWEEDWKAGEEDEGVLRHGSRDRGVPDRQNRMCSSQCFFPISQKSM